MLPKVGSKIEVTVRNKTDFMLVWYPKTTTFAGTVVPAHSWLDDATFCLTSETGFVRSIPLAHVVEMRDVQSGAVSVPTLTKAPKNQEWTVTGSKGDTYTVARVGGKWSCNCVAGQFRKVMCKHIKSIQAQKV